MLERALNGARLASNGVWVWRNGCYYGFGETPEAALRDYQRTYFVATEHEALVEFIKAGHSD